MRELTKIVDDLEGQILLLLENQKVLSGRNEDLLLQVEGLRKENAGLKAEVEALQHQVQSLRAANALLGSNEFKRETKLKINSLIREIDQVIVQLSQ